MGGRTPHQNAAGRVRRYVAKSIVREPYHISSNQGFPISRDENASDVGVKIVELWIAKMSLGRRSGDLDARSYISACGN